MKAIFAQYLILVLRLVNVGEIDSLGLAGRDQKLLSTNDVLLLELTAEPLIDFIFRLRALDNIQPVAAWPLRIL